MVEFSSLECCPLTAEPFWCMSIPSHSALVTVAQLFPLLRSLRSLFSLARPLFSLFVLNEIHEETLAQPSQPLVDTSARS